MQGFTRSSIFSLLIIGSGEMVIVPRFHELVLHLCHIMYQKSSLFMPGMATLTLNKSANFVTFTGGIYSGKIL